LHFQLASDLVQNWITSNPEASICTSEGVHQFKAMANFQDYHGLPQFRQVSDNEMFFFFYVVTSTIKITHITIRSWIQLRVKNIRLNNINIDS
jgi:hypothetical protein